MIAVPFGGTPIASVSTRGGDPVAAITERLKSEPKKWTKGSRFLSAAQTTRVFRTASEKHIRLSLTREDYVDVVVIRSVVPLRGRGVSNSGASGARYRSGPTQGFFSRSSIFRSRPELRGRLQARFSRVIKAALARARRGPIEARYLFSAPWGAVKTLEARVSGPAAQRQIFAKLRKLFLFDSSSGKFCREIRVGGGGGAR